METAIIITAVSAFISTNLDDLFILATLFSNQEFRAIDVLLGQYLGFIILLTVSSLAYFIRFIIPSQWISLLGIIPIIIGVNSLLNLKPGPDGGNTSELSKYKDGRKILAVALITVANGGDNLGIYMPLFASMNSLGLFLTAFIFLIMVGVWCLFGFKLVNNRILGDKIKDFGHHILPFVMIILGLVIILKGWV